MRSSRIRMAAIIVGAAALTLTGCTQSHSDHKMADMVEMNEQWASAADSGMAAVFGTLSNTGHHDVHIVSATSPAAGTVEIHEVVGATGGSKTMRPKEGGLTIPAGGTHDLAPGGDHLMLMELTAPLHPGADVEVTMVFEDGSTLPVTAQVRDFPGGNENYQPAAPQDHG
ncbi:copper(I)-binding protein [Mycobacterium frederiksbergense]|uniref:Copper(I)-binding protein n=1 Tax=Mycolicibacterium frederiksbergense TaxID=117567 RepID=A0ABT6KXN0_9MYCO|nr:copper chaperone PCu(A)C [Mycolicibacterium frederiksbergense]MDH6195456.1 copper(I)-binding protein [Mycolicibacterium frederiksbergense]